MLKETPSAVQITSSSVKKWVGLWLFGAVVVLLLLVATAALLAERFLNSPDIKEKIQHIVATQAGVEIDYRAVGISYFPVPMLELQQLALNVPDRAQGTVAVLRFSPQFSGLLAGQLQLGLVELAGPEISLQLPDDKPVETAERSTVPAGGGNILVNVPGLLRQLAAGIHLRISDGRFTVASASQNIVGDDLDLNLVVSADSLRSGRGTLEAALSQLSIQEKEYQETITGLHLRIAANVVDGETSVQLEKLVLAEPALELEGSMSHGAPEITLSLSAQNIDVDATRKTALALAGNISPIQEIFKYLAGGTVPQISFHSQGKRLSDLGDYHNFRIEGHLQNGLVSIPEIQLDLTEVNGDVVIANGILSGTGLSTRLEGSTGDSGMLKVGLAEDSDLFQLELMLSADLEQVQKILQGIVELPAFGRELDRITKLKGTSRGKLILGDSLNDIHARVKDSDLNFSFNYERVPFPISITSGQLELSKNSIDFKSLQGSLGGSKFSGLDCTVDWGETLFLDISTKESSLLLDELYPWLSSLADVKPYLRELNSITGGLDLNAASFNGRLDQPKTWQYTADGALSGVTVATPRFPADINLAQGTFVLDREKFTLKNTAVVSRDANLKLSGTITNRKSVELSLDGTLGEKTIAWLEKTLETPAVYAITSPLALSGAKLTWQPEGVTAFSGKVAIANGPVVTLDLANGPKSLKIDMLKVKDLQSDAAMTFSTGQGGLNFSFKGKLNHATIAKLFVDANFGEGQLEGDVAVAAAEMKTAGATAKGQLKGSDVILPFASGEEVAIEQIVLDADGSEVKAAVTMLSWHDFVWSPFKATITFADNNIRVKVSQAALCGIDSPGFINFSGKNIALDFKLQGEGLDVGTSYTCLTQGNVKMTGKMDFSSQIRAKGEVSELVSTLEGPLKMTFNNGVITRHKVLSTVLEVLNVTEIVKGRLPNLARSGFAYTTITVDGQFKNGKLLLEKLYMDGDALDILGYGEIDIVKETVNIELMAAPFKTVDAIIKYIPGLNYLMGNRLVAIPVRVKGDLANPKVTVMSISSVSKSLLNLGERTIKMPFKLIEAVISETSTSD